MSQPFVEECLKNPKDERYRDYLVQILWHELFHCLTRCNPDFRADMYKLIHFTVVGEDYKLPKSVEEYHISNPDVEHHDSYATFRIDGNDTYLAKSAVASDLVKITVQKKGMGKVTGSVNVTKKSKKSKKSKSKKQSKKKSKKKKSGK